MWSVRTRLPGESPAAPMLESVADETIHAPVVLDEERVDLATSRQSRHGGSDT